MSAGNAIKLTNITRRAALRLMGLGAALAAKAFVEAGCSSVTPPPTQPAVTSKPTGTLEPVATGTVPPIQPAEPSILTATPEPAETKTTYYVDASGGDDRNDGTSVPAAWKTISRVNASTFRPGDKILFKCGEMWRGENLAVSNSGASGSYILYSHYGTGSNPIINPTLEYSDFTLHRGTVWKRSLSYDPFQVFEDDVRLTLGEDSALASGGWFWDGSAHTLYIRCTDDGDPNTGHVIEHRAQKYNPAFTFNSQSHIRVDGIDIYKPERGFSWGMTLTGDKCTASDDIVVTNCEVSWASFRGFCMGTTNAGHTNVTISKCTAHDTNIEGFWVGHGSNIQVNDCVAYNGGLDRSKMGKQFVGTGGILCGIYSVNVTVKGCHVHDNYHGACLMAECEEGYAGAPRPQNVVFDGNLVEMNVDVEEDSGLLDEGTSTVMSNNVIIRSNATSGNLILIDDNSNGAMIYHNTLINNYDKYWTIRLDNCTQTTIKNNIIYGAGHLYAVKAGESASGFAIDYNDYYGVDNLRFRYKSGPIQLPLASWRLLSNQDAHSIDHDPEFIANFTDLHLDNGSPCIGAGDAAVGVSRDYDGVMRGADVDMGAYEHISSTGL